MPLRTEREVAHPIRVERARRKPRPPGELLSGCSHSKWGELLYISDGICPWITLLFLGASLRELGRLLRLWRGTCRTGLSGGKASWDGAHVAQGEGRRIPGSHGRAYILSSCICCSKLVVAASRTAAGTLVAFILYYKFGDKDYVTFDGPLRRAPGAAGSGRAARCCWTLK